MPEMGVRLPPKAPHVSHTATQQWQSFEVRMRYRRAERCLLRAEAALEAGLEDEARAALDEARTLNSETPDFESLRATVHERQEIAVASTHRARARGIAGVALGAAAVLAVAVTLWPGSRVPAPVATGSSAATTPAPAVSQAALQSEIQPTPSTVPPAPRAADVPVPGPAVPASNSAVRTSGEAPAAEPPLPILQPDPPAAAPPPYQTTLPAVESADPAVRLTASPIVETTSVTTAPSASSGAERLVKDLPSASVPHPPVAPPPPDPRTIEEPKVRAVLSQFESAYSNLSASAAQAVWPSVDERGLSRAFDSLESQDVSLGRCTIAFNGATAVAECTGTTSWTPKVGGGRRSQLRTWHFDLTNAGGKWLIERAEAR